MGREPKILLALLATLTGVFLGVLSMKLLLPRPPVAVGPDVAIDLSGANANELVEPPTLSPSTAGPLTAGTTVAEAAPRPHPRDDRPLPVAAADDLLPPPAAAAAADHAPQRRDPFVAQATLQAPVAEPEPPRDPQPVPAAPLLPAPPPTAAYVTTPGDSWWDLAERAYGDGRLYRALFAWNRVIDPRVSLTPGTRLEVPPRTRLEAAWPKLMPVD